MIDPRQLALLEQQHGLPAGLLSAVQQQESGGNTSAVSPAGARGAFQFMPATARAYGINPFDEAQAADGAARMFGDLSKQYGGDLPNMLAGYNWGSGNLAKKGMQNAPAETRNYINKVTQSLPQSAQADAGTVTDFIPTSNEITNIAPSNIMDVEMPDGTIIEGVPPSTTKSELMKKYSKLGAYNPPQQQPQQASNLGFFGRVDEDYAKREKMGNEIAARGISGGQSALSTRLIEAGNVAGLAGDVAGEGLNSLYKAAFTEKTRERLGNAASAAGNNLPNVGLMDTLRMVGQGYHNLEQDYPTTTGLANSAFNIGTLLPIGRGAKAAASEAVSPVLTGVGSAIEKSGIASQLAKDTKHIESLVAPKLTGKAGVQAGKKAYNEGGLMGEISIEQTPWQQDQIQHVLNTGVKSGDNPVQAIGKIQSANSAEELKKVADLKNSNITYKQHIDDISATSLNDMLGDTNLVQYAPDGQTIVINPQARMALNQAKIIMKKHPNTPIGLYNARKEFDAWAKTKNTGVFDKDSIMNSAATAVRNNMNQYITKFANADYINSLNKQSALIKAENAIAPKAAKLVGTNRFKRLAESVTGATTPVGAGARAVGAGLALSAPALAAGINVLPVAAGVYGTYKLGKGIASPAVRKALGGTIRKTGEAIK